ncbi:MAG: methyltransferase [Veillonellaceae bacterium]|nr:methyltransferase [Veillonellaceae bacterium]
MKTDGATTEFVLRDGERLDDLVRDGMYLIQHPQEFCMTTDAVLLAHFATLKRADRCWDLGTGTGVIPLLLCSRGARDITAVECNPRLADMAARSASGNGHADKIRVLTADYRDYAQFPAAAADLVVVNPPYMAAGRGACSRTAGARNARHEVRATRDDVVAAGRHLLRHGGRLALVQRAERAVEWLAALETARLRVKRLRWVHSYADGPAKLVLMEARLHGNPGTEVLPPLVLYRAPGEYTDDLLRFYTKEAPQ